MNKNTNITPIHSDSVKTIPHVQKVSEFMQFTRCLATPRQLRNEKTQKDFAKSIGVNQDTLVDWKKCPQL